MPARGSAPLPMAGDAPQGAPGLDRRAPITVDSLRGGHLESRHVVYGVLLDGSGAADAVRGVAWGDADVVTFARSAWKPFQALPFVVDGAMDAFDMGDAELALAVASHSAQPQHLEVLRSMLQRAGLEPGMLRCPGHAPIHEPSAKALAGAWDARHDNCSGKHAAMLAWCRHRGVDETGYRQPEHPLQERILSLVGALSASPRRELGVAFDGCTATALAVPLERLARLYLHLGDPDRLPQTREGAALGAEAARVQAALARVRDAMVQHPLLVAGEGRVDTEIVNATQGALITKSGAEGVWCGVHLTRRVAFAFKTIDGAFRAVVPAALAALADAGVPARDEMEALAKHAEPVLRDRAGGRVGRVRAVLP